MTKLSIVKDRSLYKFVLLNRERIDMAYALVRESSSPIYLNQWRGYAQSLVSDTAGNAPPVEGADQHGIIVAEAPADYIRGLVAYHVCADLMVGRRLNLDCIAVPDAFDRRAIANALSAEFDRFAKEMACQTIVIPLEKYHAWLSPYFHGNGYSNAEIQVRFL